MKKNKALISINCMLFLVLTSCAPSLEKDAIADYQIWNNILSLSAGSSASSNPGSGTSGSTLSCPTNYVLVPFDTAVGTTADFCVAKYEMKNVGAIATSQAALTPWAPSGATSATYCTDLGARYHLITNPEWMTIARNMETTADNWSTGVVYSGTLSKGQSDGAPSATLAASTDDDPCNGTGQVCSDVTWDLQRRTMKLSNGSVIWDFTGNAWEWSDWTVDTANKAYRLSDAGPIDPSIEYPLMDTYPLSNSTAYRATNLTLNSANGYGVYYAGSVVQTNMAIRGGNYFGTGGGIFALNLSNLSSVSSADISFRCTYQ